MLFKIVFKQLSTHTIYSLCNVFRLKINHYKALTKFKLSLTKLSQLRVHHTLKFNSLWLH